MKNLEPRIPPLPFFCTGLVIATAFSVENQRAPPPICWLF